MEGNGQAYLKALPSLNIVSGSLNLEEKQELQDLRKQVQALTQEVTSLTAQRHNVAMDTYLDKEWVREQALIIIKQSAKELGVDWQTGKPPKQEE